MDLQWSTAPNEHLHKIDFNLAAKLDMDVLWEIFQCAHECYDLLYLCFCKI